jgi:hypothetical protein
MTAPVKFIEPMIKMLVFTDVSEKTARGAPDNLAEIVGETLMITALY